jgi:chromatin segregation and condensation protein Rec8/ScpA/Scc1 (kleisin family)
MSSLSQTLSIAQTNPELAQFTFILQLLEEALPSLSTSSGLQLAGDTISTISEIYQKKADILFSSLETTTSDDLGSEPILDDDLLSGLLRHSLTLNLDDLTEQPSHKTPKKANSINKTISKEELFQLIDDKRQEEENWQVSHEENFSDWQKKIDRYLSNLPTNTNEISLLQLSNAIDLPLSALWLTLLLGDYQLEQLGDFYESESIWITNL